MYSLLYVRNIRNILLFRPELSQVCFIVQVNNVEIYVISHMINCWTIIQRSIQIPVFSFTQRLQFVKYICVWFLYIGY